MKTRILMIVMLAFFGLNNLLKAQTPTWEWARCPSGYGQGEGISIASDAIGNSYLIGTFADTMIFGSDTLVGGGACIFIAKYNSSGNPVWAKCAKGNGISYGANVATDVFGNVYLSGHYSTQTNLFFDTDSITNSGILLAKYNSLGNLVWVKSYGAYVDDEPLGIATDNSGNVFLSGAFVDSLIIFGATTLINSSHDNIFIVKMDSSGSTLWAKNGRCGGGSASTGLAIDYFGNVYVTGYYSSPLLIFGSDTLTRVGITDLFLLKYSSSGNLMRSKDVGGTGQIIPYSVITNSIGKVYITGYFNSHGITFGTYVLDSANVFNVFLVQYNSNGNVDWAKASSIGGGYGFSIGIDSCKNIIIAGPMCRDSLTFDSILLTSNSFANGDNMFIAQFNSLGNAIWGTTLTCGGDDNNGIAFDASNNMFLGGDFVPSPSIIGNDTLTHPIGELPFVAKLHFTCNTETGLNEIPTTHSLLLSPNPFTNTTTLTLQSSYHSPTLFIYNLMGQEVSSLSIGSNKQITIIRNNLPAGMYFYKVIEDNKEVLGIGKMVVE